MKHDTSPLPFMITDEYTATDHRAVLTELDILNQWFENKNKSYPERRPAINPSAGHGPMTDERRLWMREDENGRAAQRRRRQRERLEAKQHA